MLVQVQATFTYAREIIEGRITLRGLGTGLFLGPGVVNSRSLIILVTLEGKQRLQKVTTVRNQVVPKAISLTYT